jgi:hypothetical protein
MKKLKIKMTKKLEDLASNHIRTKNHIILLLLESIPILTYGEIVESATDGFILLRIDKMKRLFFVFKKKIFSFNFPFNVEVLEGENNTIIYDPITNLEINGLNYAILKATFEEIIYRKENQGIQDLDSDLLQIMESFEMKPNKDLIWEILKKLLIFESGYLRYDYDDEHEDGKMHPLNHLDVNYSSDGTFKIGLNDNIDSDIFIDIIDVNTESYYISK